MTVREYQGSGCLDTRIEMQRVGFDVIDIAAISMLDVLRIVVPRLIILCHRYRICLQLSGRFALLSLMVHVEERRHHPVIRLIYEAIYHFLDHSSAPSYF